MTRVPSGSLEQGSYFHFQLHIKRDFTLIWAKRACLKWKYGCGSKPMLPFWGTCTTHFRTYFSGDWDVHCGYDLAFDPWPYLFEPKRNRFPSLDQHYIFSQARCQSLVKSGALHRIRSSWQKVTLPRETHSWGPKVMSQSPQQNGKYWRYWRILSLDRLRKPPSA